MKAVFGSFFGKFGVVSLLVAGATGGLAVTGEIPGLGFTPEQITMASAESATGRLPGVTLDFPNSVLQKRVEAASGAVTEVVEEIVVVSAPRTPLARTRAAAAVPAPRCVEEVTNALNAIAGAIPAITTGEQGRALLAQANAVSVVAGSCAAEAKQVGFAGIEGVNSLVNQAGAVVAQISAIPAVAASPQPGQPDLVGGVVGGVGSVVGGTLNLVGDGVGLLGTGLNMLTSPLN